MAKSEALNAQFRTTTGTRANKRLRSQGMIPGVVYGHKEAVVSISVPGRELVRHLQHGTHVFDLSMDGGAQKVLVKEVQYDHLGKEVLHIDFARVSLDERVEVTVPLELRGTPKGEEDGGVLQQIIAELEIECVVTEIPELIRHNVSEMKLDDVLHIRDIQLPPGVKCLQDGDLIVASVKEIVEAAAPSEAGEAAEPEVIGRKAEEEGEGEEEK